MYRDYVPDFSSGQDALQHYMAWPDMSRLTPSQLANYHLAASALQWEALGFDTHLSSTAHDMAQANVASTHHELVVGSIDALTKEVSSPNGGTIIGDEVSHTASVKAATHHPILETRYDHIVPADIECGSDGIDRYQPFARRVLAMRTAAAERREDRAAVREIARDVADLTHVYLLEKRREEASRSGPSNDKWFEFTGYLSDFATELDKGETSQKALIQATRILNATHSGNANMLQRFTDIMTEQGAQKFHDLYAVLEAAHMPTYEPLLRHAGYLGGLMHSYLTGQQKSLTRLPSGQAIPTAFDNR